MPVDRVAEWSNVRKGDTITLTACDEMHTIVVAAFWHDIPGVVWLQDAAGRSYFSGDWELVAVGQSA